MDDFLIAENQEKIPPLPVTNERSLKGTKTSPNAYAVPEINNTYMYGKNGLDLFFCEIAPAETLLVLVLSLF